MSGLDELSAALGGGLVGVVALAWRWYGQRRLRRALESLGESAEGFELRLEEQLRYLDSVKRGEREARRGR